MKSKRSIFHWVFKHISVVIGVVLTLLLSQRTQRGQVKQLNCKELMTILYTIPDSKRWIALHGTVKHYYNYYSGYLYSAHITVLMALYNIKLEIIIKA